MKVCGHCKKSKPISEFAVKNKAKNKHYSICKKCKRTYNRIHYQQKIQYYKDKATISRRVCVEKTRDFIWNYFLTHPCVDCGENDPIILEFDHINPKEKEFKISSVAWIKKISLEKIKAEIAKCEVRCANCHRRKTAKDLNYWADKRNVGESNPPMVLPTTD